MSYIKRLLSDSSGEPNLKLHGAAFCLLLISVFGGIGLYTGGLVQGEIITALTTIAVAGFTGGVADNYLFNREKNRK